MFVKRARTIDDARPTRRGPHPRVWGWGSFHSTAGTRSQRLCPRPLTRAPADSRAPVRTGWIVNAPVSGPSTAPSPACSAHRRFVASAPHHDMPDMNSSDRVGVGPAGKVRSESARRLLRGQECPAGAVRSVQPAQSGAATAQATASRRHRRRHRGGAGKRSGGPSRHRPQQRNRPGHPKVTRPVRELREVRTT